MQRRVKSLDAILATASTKSLKRSLSWPQLTMLGIGGIIGTGIFVLTAEAAQKAGPGMIISFVLAATVCGLAALCYAEIAAMIPVAGSAYTYAYATFGEFFAWIVGWALVLEYAVAASAVAVGFSGYLVGLLDHSLGIVVPHALAVGPYAGGIINLPAVLIAIAVTLLLIRGTQESANVNAFLVAIKILALTMFVILTLPLIDSTRFHPFNPLGFMGSVNSKLGENGIIGAASSIFFAFVGFDAVSTAAEETKNPQRNVPIGLVLSLVICTIFYMLVAAGVVGSIGAQPVFDALGHWVAPGTPALTQACDAVKNGPVVCSHEALAYVLHVVNYPWASVALGVAATVALPSVVLMMMYAQTRIFFVMSRDGLLPRGLSKVHSRYKTPHVVTMMTGALVTVAAAFFPVGALADISNGGTLCAFAFVALAIMALRRRDPLRHRPFRTPAVWVIAPLAVFGCVGLFVFLTPDAKTVFFGWLAVGLIVYFAYARQNSNVAKGVIEVGEIDPAAPPIGLAPIGSAHTPGWKDA